jgi:hypothetical protein
MDISINGKTADITLESERTVGEVLSGIESWLHSSGFTLNGLEIDGEPVLSDAVSAAFERELGGVSAIDIKICSRSELAMDALGKARDFLAAYWGAIEQNDGEESTRIGELWTSSAAASFLAVENPELYRIITGVFDTAPGPSRAKDILPLIDERIREIADPRAEILKMEGMVEEVAGRLEDLPLDIQTGKDGRAAESVTIFSALAEKLFRLFYLIQARGEDLSGVSVKNISPEPEGILIYDFLREFSAALKELIAAYEAKDVVLVGDLAEYELAPRFRVFYRSLKIPQGQ